MNQNPDMVRGRMLGVALGPRDTDVALSEFAAVRERADIIELRLDLMSEYDLKTLVSESPLPLVVTNRPLREGGRYAGDEGRRVAILLEALELGAQYIDIELDAIQLASIDYRDRMVVSHHDFERMTPDLERIQHELTAAGTGIVKVVGMARRPEDSLAALQIYERSKTPTIGIAMGAHGLISRVLALRYDNCFLTYGTAVAGEEVAPGQLALSTLTEVYRAREIGAGTAAFAVAFDEIDEALLADLNGQLRQRGADAVAVPLESQFATPATLAAFKDYGFSGMWDVSSGVVRGGDGWEREGRAGGAEHVADWWAGLLLKGR